MKNEIQVFNFEQSAKVSVITDENNNPWWVAKEVCEVLGIKNPSQALQELDLDEKASIKLSPQDISKTYDTSEISDLAQPKQYRIVNEPGLYSLILRSRKPQAKRFKRWITHEVIPAIRKTGGYILGENEMSEDELMAQAVLVANRKIDMLREENRKLKEENRVVAFITGSDADITLKEMAQVSNTGVIRFNKLLREAGYLQQITVTIGYKKQKINIPMQKYIEAGYFKTKTVQIDIDRGQTFETYQTLVTPEGQLHLASKFGA